MFHEISEQVDLPYNRSIVRKKTLSRLEKLSRKKEITDEDLFAVIVDTFKAKPKRRPHTHRVWYKTGECIKKTSIGYFQSEERGSVSERVILDKGPDGNVLIFHKNPGGLISTFKHNDATGKYDLWEIPLTGKIAIVKVLQGALGR